MTDNKLPDLGFGLGLRPKHYLEILANSPAIDFFEIITENFTVEGGKPLYYLDQIAELYPIVMHGVAMSLGSAKSLDVNYLKKVKTLKQRINAKWISDHLCFSSIGHHSSHDLLPIVFNEESLKLLTQNIIQAQDYLGEAILIENISTYLTYTIDNMSEYEFIAELLNKTGAYLLLDVNNVYVNSVNHEFNPFTAIEKLPASRIQQIHLAGHLNCGTHLIDTHDHPITSEVWNLYKHTLKHTKRLVSTMIERDDNIPELNELIVELETAKHHATSVLNPDTEVICVE